MPRVKLPLGSARASGKFGNIAVFQGETVRSLVTPNDPKTLAQLAARNSFYDVSKTIKAAGAYARAVFSMYYGPRWFTVIPRQLVSATNPLWINATAAWAARNSETKLAWGNAAPFENTYSEKGEVFFKLLHAMGRSFPGYVRDFTEFVDPDLNLPADSLTWWTKPMTDVLTKGETESTSSMFIYNGTWNTVTNALAHGGSYKSKVLASGGYIKFFFYGVKYSIKYMKAPNLGTFGMELDGVSAGSIVQNNATQLWQQLYTSPELERGLHQVFLNTGAGVEVNLDSVIISNKKAVTQLPVPEVLLNHSALTNRDVDDHTQYLTNARGDARYPLKTATDPYSVYYNQARGDARYPQIAHVHTQVMLLGTALEDATLASGASNTGKLFRSGLGGTGYNVPIPLAGTLKNLYLRTGTTQPASGSLTCTLNVNNSQKSIVATCPANGAGATYSDTTHTYAISAGDVVWFDLKNNATATSAKLVSVVIVLELNTG